MTKIKQAFGATALLVLALPILVLAKSEEKNNWKVPEAKDIKIHKKQLISEEERKALDEAAKGKPADRAPKVNVPAFLATGVLGDPLPEGGKRYAIVAGLANYTGVVNDLCVAAAKTYEDDPTDPTQPSYYCQDKDAANMKDALVSEYGFPLENITHLRDSQATRDGILAAMTGLKSKIGPNDEVVFFFSGHGTSGKLVSLKDNETVDEAIFVYDGKVIWDDELKIWADSLGVNRMAFVFDICLAGGMNDLSAANRVVAMSSGETQSSYTYYLGGMLVDGSYQKSEGLFSHYFVFDGITNNFADGWNTLSEKDEKIALEESFTYTYPIVKNKQIPVLADKFTNDFLP